MSWEELKQLGEEYTDPNAITFSKTAMEKDVAVGFLCFRERHQMEAIIKKLNGKLGLSK